MQSPEHSTLQPGHARWHMLQLVANRAAINHAATNRVVSNRVAINRPPTNRLTTRPTTNRLAIRYRAATVR